MFKIFFFDINDIIYLLKMIKLNSIIDKIKNKFFNFSKEAAKIKRPSYEELIKYQNFSKSDNNKLALSFGAGRSGQNWFSKIFNSHLNWIGTCERFQIMRLFIDMSVITICK